MEDKLYCPIRRRWVKEQPEELLRQQLLAEMIHSLGYPQAWLAIEKGLNQLPHLHLQKVPPRRINLLAFYLKQQRLSPLLLVECKATRWTERAILQLIGYNRLIQAPFITLASLKEVCTLSYDQTGRLIPFCAGIPSFSSLLGAVSN